MRRNSNGISARVLVMAVALTLIIGGIIGGSVAWLTAKTDELVNTFTVGNIDITLAETTTDFKMVPGNTISKDPKVTVKAGSEACYLFVKVTESDNLKSFISYTVDTAEGKWTKLNGVDGNVYYRVVEAATADTSFDILTSNQVSVKDSVTKEQLQAVKNDNKPTLSFIAYAVQKDNIDNAADAWAKVNP